MGSSLSHAHWTAIAIVCGLLYLIFDAARSFVQQVGPVTLRRWSGDPEMEAARRWFQYDPRNLQLLSGAMLQISLVVAMAATVMAFDDHPTWEACLYAVVLWIVVAACWKFVLAFIPEDLGEKFLRGLLPFSHFFYLLCWPGRRTSCRRRRKSPSCCASCRASTCRWPSSSTSTAAPPASSPSRTSSRRSSARSPTSTRRRRSPSSTSAAASIWSAACFAS